MMQQKFNRFTKRLLIDFEAKIRHRIFYKLRKRRFHRIRSRFKWWSKYNNNLNFKKKPSFYFSSSLSKKNPKNLFEKKKQSLKKVFYNSLHKYFNNFKKISHYRSKLEAFWVKKQIKRLKYLTPKIFGRLRANFLVKRKVKRGKFFFISENLHNKLELLKKQFFFCFSTLSQIRRYIKRVEFCRHPNPLFLGLEGSFLNLIFRTNLFPTTKEAYVFIRLGAFEINNKKTKKPYKILSVYDTFRVRPPFIKKIWSSFSRRVSQDLLLFNIPNYIDFDYKLLTFFIWRLPTKLEKRITYFYPFLSRTSNIEVYPNQKNEFIVPKDLEVIRIPKR